MNKSESKYFNTAIKMDKAFLALLEEKDFEYITVKELCKRADVNRSTFYLHYENMTDLLAESIEYMYDDKFYGKTQEYPYQPAISDKEDISKILDLYIEKYYDENDDKQTWFDKIKALAVEMGYAGEVKEFKANPGMYKAHVGDVSTVLRVALTSRTNTPDMYEIMQILGKDRIAKRFEVAKENLK